MSDLISHKDFLRCSVSVVIEFEPLGACVLLIESFKGHELFILDLR